MAENYSMSIASANLTGRGYDLSSEEFFVRRGAPSERRGRRTCVRRAVRVEEQRRMTENYSMSIASPNEKKRYRSETAILYALRMRSRPARAETNIKSVDWGR